MRRHYAVAFGALAAVTALLLMAPSGGFPSRPRFQAIGLGTAAGGNGTISATDSGGLILQLETGDPLFVLDNTEGALFSLGAAQSVSASRGETLFGAGLHHVATAVKSGADLLVGDTITITKNAGTSRANDATLSADNDLQVTNLPAGHYALEAWLHATEGGGGFKWRIDAPVAARMHLTRWCGSNGNSFVDITVQTTCATGNPYFTIATGTTDAAMTTGTVSIFWAQNATNAVATVLEPDSYLKVTRLK